MFNDLIVYDGIEVANADRTLAYARAGGMADVQSSEGCEGFSGAMGLGPYVTPADDPAPWYDLASSASGAFYGLLPMEVLGADDSTHTADVLSGLHDGGVVAGIRHAEREMRVRGVLLAGTDEAARYGLAWLESVLHDGDVCNPNDPCSLPTWEMLAACPLPAEVCGDPLPGVSDPQRLWRRALGTALLEGPKVLQRFAVRGGVAWEVEFTVVSGNPYWYGRALDLAAVGAVGTYREWNAWAVSLPQADTYGGLVQWAESFTPPKTYADTVAEMWRGLLGGWASGSGPAPLPPSTTVPPCFLDPDCPPLPTMPAYPQAPLGCGPAYTGTYREVAFRVQRNDVPGHVASALALWLHADGVAYKDIRVTFTRDGSPTFDFRYHLASLPANATYYADGATGQVTLTCGTETRSAAHLVGVESVSPGQRFPLLRCGQAYTVLIEVPATYDPAHLQVDMALSARAA